jgi:hypothetical protein
MDDPEVEGEIASEVQDEFAEQREAAAMAGFTGKSASLRQPGEVIDVAAELVDGDDDDQGEQVQTAAVEKPAPAQDETVAITKKQFDELMAQTGRVEKAEQGLATAFGHIGGLKRATDQLAAGKPAFAIKPETIAQFREEKMDDIADAMEVIAGIKAIPSTPDQKAIDEMVEARVQALLPTIRTESDHAYEAKALKRVHPDWETYRSSPEFQDWTKKQPADFIEKLRKADLEWDSSVISDAMSRAKAAAKPAAPNPSPTPPPQKRSRLYAAVTPRGTGGSQTGPVDPFEFAEAGFQQAIGRR